MLFSVLYNKVHEQNIYLYLYFLFHVSFNRLFCCYGFKFLTLANWLLIQHVQKQELDNDKLLLLLLLLLLFDMDVSCHRPSFLGASLEPAVIPTAQASSFTLQYFPYYV